MPFLSRKLLLLVGIFFISLLLTQLHTNSYVIRTGKLRTTNSRTNLKNLKNSSFFEKLYNIDWEHATEMSFTNLLLPYLVKEPITQVNLGCVPEKLAEVDNNLCSGAFNRDVFSGEIR